MNNQCHVVTREGVVTQVTGSRADVRIVQVAACASCVMHGVCTSGDVTAKTITTTVDDPVQPGQRVMLSMPERTGLLGVLVAFVLPLVVAVTTLFVVQPHVANDAYAGLAAVAMLVPYFAVVSRFRGYFERVVKFTVTPLQAKEGST